VKNLKIGNRIGLAFGAILVLFLIVSTISMVSLRQNNGKFVDFFNNGHQIDMQTLEMRRDIQSAAKNVGYATMSLDLQTTVNILILQRLTLKSFVTKYSF
jgi:methyl-accepting chemotaxis protein